jgi:beta-glucosidase
LEDNAVHSFVGDKEVYPGDKDNGYKQVYKEDIYVGYRWHETKNIAPLFAFGHGLSYTTFVVDKVNAVLKGDAVRVTATVTNSGTCDGAEVVQVYVGMKESKVERATKELKGFAKVDLKAGETKTVTIDVPVKKLAYYNEQKADWDVEVGTYTMYVGTASDKIVANLDVAIN